MDIKKIDKLLAWLSIGVLGIFVLKEFVVFIILVVLSAIVQYWSYRQEIKLSIGHVFFLSLLISRTEGIRGAILFILAGGMLPEIIAGNLDGRTIIAYPLMAAFAILCALVTGIDLSILGILLAVIYYSLMYLVSGVLGESLPEKILEVALPLLLNLIYFTSFTNQITGFVGYFRLA